MKNDFMKNLLSPRLRSPFFSPPAVLLKTRTSNFEKAINTHLAKTCVSIKLGGFMVGNAPPVAHRDDTAACDLYAVVVIVITLLLLLLEKFST